MEQAVFCLIGAFVGAGFASGREIVQFFSRFGPFSWMLIPLASALMVFLMRRGMERGTALTEAGNGGKKRWAVRGLLILLFAFAGGGMKAAAGELAALTVPVKHARSLGGLLTLGLCAALASKPLKALEVIGKLLLPALAVAMLFCLRIPGNGGAAPEVSFPQLVLAVAQAAGYAGLNVLLSLGVLRDAGTGRSRAEQRRLAWGTGIVFALLLCLANAAFLPHIGELLNAALPTVLLLRNYGKAGYYVAAAVLYLAVISTLIAVLRGLDALLPGRHAWAWAALLSALTSQLGFRDIVGKAYPILGGLCFLLLTAPNVDQIIKLQTVHHSHRIENRRV